MRQYKVYNKQKDPKGHFLELVDTFTLERLKNKALAEKTNSADLNGKQEGQKVFINSAYGTLAAPGLNYNYPEGAEFITEKGREVLSHSVEYATGQNVDFWKSKAGIVEEEENEAVG